MRRTILALMVVTILLCGCAGATTGNGVEQMPNPFTMPEKALTEAQQQVKETVGFLAFACVLSPMGAYAEGVTTQDMLANIEVCNPEFPDTAALLKTYAEFAPPEDYNTAVCMLGMTYTGYHAHYTDPDNPNAQKEAMATWVTEAPECENYKRSLDNLGN